jgi:hypothetical protein
MNSFYVFEARARLALPPLAVLDLGNSPAD